MSEQNAQALSKLFPSSTSFKSKRKFNPIDECLVDEQKRKKSTSTRSKGPSIPLVYLPKMTVHVPRGNVRGQLSKQGRIKKELFRRNMKPSEVKAVIVEAFSEFSLDNFMFLKCGQDNRLQVLENKEICGDEILDVAGQGSLYICSVRRVCLWLFLCISHV